MENPSSDRPSVRAAASVVLVRRRQGEFEVFWVRRGKELKFAGGFYAFPGGAVDLADAALPLLHSEGLGSAEAPCVAAAARELFEETGVLLVPGAERVPPQERRAMRTALLRRAHERGPGEGPANFGALLSAHGLVADAALFTPAGRWVTPQGLGPTRFDARFFLAEMPASETAEVWPGELADGEWIRPEAALGRWERGTGLLHPPAWHTLRALAHGKSSEGALPFLQDPARAPWHLPIEQFVVERIEFQRGIVMVPLRTPTLPPATHTNCLLLGDEELWVVDPGSPYPEEQEVLAKTLATLASEGRRATGVLLTHHHLDHTGGAERLRRDLGLPIATTAETQALLDFKADRLLRDGELLPLGPRGFRCLHLPGHTRGHLCLRDEGSGAVIAGDLVAGIGTVIIDPPEGDMADYLESLRRLLSLEPGTLYPAHGPVVPAGKEKLQGYLAHRLEREEKVAQALRLSGPATPLELVPHAYPEIAPALYPFAERSLLAHLLKLVKDGRAREGSGRYRAN